MRRSEGVGTAVVAGVTAVAGLLVIAAAGPAARGGPLRGEAVPAVAPDPTVATSTEVDPPPPIPLAVESSATIVGAGGTVTFSGRCPVAQGGPLGPLAVRVTGPAPRNVDTGTTAESWTWEWTAPIEEAAAGSYTFRFWCGDPAGYDGEYPVALERAVDMVAVAEPPLPPPTTDVTTTTMVVTTTTTTTTIVASSPPVPSPRAGTIPVTE